MSNAPIGIAILTTTIGVALARPRIGSLRVRPWVAALLGAVATVAVGLVDLAQVGGILSFLSGPLTVVASLMVTTIVAERAGLFAVLADALWRAARGSGARLLAYVYVSAAVVGMLFTNDAAILIFTPLVYSLVEHLSGGAWSMRQKLPYYFAVLYAGNLVGPLIISNPIHLVVGRWFDLDFMTHAAWMALPALVAALVTFGLLYYVFRGDLPSHVPALPALREPVKRPGFMAVAAVVLTVTLAAFFLELALPLPLPAIAAIGAAVLWLVDTFFTRDTPDVVGRRISWSVLVFVAGIFVVATGLREAGLTAELGELIAAARDHGALAGSLATSTLTGAASALVNNHPAADAMAIAILDLQLPPGETRLAMFAVLIGGDLGPKMLPTGSLAALIWFRLLRERGVEVSFRRYVALGVPIAVAAIIAAVLVLWLQATLA